MLIKILYDKDFINKYINISKVKRVVSIVVYIFIFTINKLYYYNYNYLNYIKLIFKYIYLSLL